MSTAAHPRITPEEYLARERSSQHKSEYVNGRIYAMVGAGRSHNRITANLLASIHAQLRGSPCEVYVSDMQVKVSPTGLCTYPDVVAVCGGPSFEDAQVDTLLTPTLIVEVLSESTEGYDRGEKFAHYRRPESLREYVLVAQDRLRVEHFAREGERWVLTEVSGAEGILELPAIGCRLELREVYERVEFAGEDEGARGR